MYQAARRNLDCTAAVRTHTDSESETEQTRDEKKDGRWSSCALRRAGASVVALMSSLLITFTAKWSRSRRAATEAQVRADWGKTQPWLLACGVHTLVAPSLSHYPSPFHNTSYANNFPPPHFQISHFLSPPSLLWYVKSSPGSFLRYMFSIRQKGDRDGGLKGELWSRRKGFTPLIHRRILMRDLKHEEMEQRRQSRHLNTCRGGEYDKHVF